MPGTKTKTDMLAMLYSEFSLLRRQMEEQMRRSEDAVTVERARFDRLLTEYMQVCQQALATRPQSMSPPPSFDTLTQGLGLFEEVQVGSKEGYSEEELHLGEGYRES